MVSAFSNPGFPPMHTHPPTLSAMVAANEDSFHATVDALFAPYLGRIRCARELALSDGGVSDPAQMISDDAAAIDPDHKTIPRVAASTDAVPPSLSSLPLLRALANPPVKPQSNSNDSMANSPNQPLHSNDFVAATFPLRTVEKTRPVVMVTTAPLFPISATSSTESSHAHNHKPVLRTKEATTRVHVLGFPLKNAEATKSVGLSHTNTTKCRHEVLRSLIYNLSHWKANWHWLLQFILAYYLGDILVIYEDFLTKKIGWINWYLVGKFLMKDLCASNLFVEMSERQSTQNLSWNNNLVWSVALGSLCRFARDMEKHGSQFHMQLNNEKDSQEIEDCGCDDDLLEEIVLVYGLHAKIGCRVAFPSHLTLTDAKELGLVAGIPIETSLIDAHVGGVGLLENVPIIDSESNECYVTKLKGHGVVDTITDKLGTSSTHRISTSEKSFNKRKELYRVHVDFISFWNATLMDKGKNKSHQKRLKRLLGT